MFYAIVAVKLILGLLALVLVINLTGKGNLAPASASDQVQNYVLGGIVGGVIYNSDISIPVFIAILTIWFAAVLSLRWLKKHNNLVKQLVDGKPVTLISRGKIDVKAVRMADLSAHELSFKLRMQGIYSVKEIKQAILEQDGQLIITSFGEENPKYPLITDGSVQKSTLEMIDKDEEWLKAELKKLGIEDASDVFLAEYDSGKISITKYEEKYGNRLPPDPWARVAGLPLLPRQRPRAHVGRTQHKEKAHAQRQQPGRPRPDPEDDIACRHAGKGHAPPLAADGPLFPPLAQRPAELRMFQQPALEAGRAACKAPHGHDEEDGGGHDRQHGADEAQRHHQPAGGEPEPAHECLSGWIGNGPDMLLHASAPWHTR